MEFSPKTVKEKQKQISTSNDYNHPSFICYIEAVSNVYNFKNELEISNPALRKVLLQKQVIFAAAPFFF